MDVREIVERAGGFATTAGLRSAGVSEHRVTAAVRAGQIVHVKRGWYSSLASDSPQVRAVAAGGRLTGVSAIDALNGWVWRRSRHLHVTVPANASRLGARRRGVTLHWERPRVAPHSVAIAGIVDCLVRVALDSDLDTAVAAFDWARRTGRLDRVDLERVILLLPTSYRDFCDYLDRESQSVLESVARARLIRRGWSVRSQGRVGELGGIDLVIEGHVALELDGRKHHESTFESDRRKDLRITVEGRHSIRVTRSMLISEWPRVERAIEAALAARRVGFSGFVAKQPSGFRRTRPLPQFDT